LKSVIKIATCVAKNQHTSLDNNQTYIPEIILNHLNYLNHTGSYQLRKRFFASGMDDYLTKPVKKNILGTMITTHKKRIEECRLSS